MAVATTKVIEGGYTIEVFVRVRGKREYFGQIHCWCGSTMSSGLYLPTIGEATREARDGMHEHERTGNHASGHFQRACDDCGGISFVRPRDNGCMVCSTCWSRRGESAL